jgi:hypothetical protein
MNKGFYFGIDLSLYYYISEYSRKFHKKMYFSSNFYTYLPLLELGNSFSKFNVQILSFGTINLRPWSYR